MFVGFLFHLRAFGLKVSVTEWLSLMQAMANGHTKSSLQVFYHLARALLVKKETLYDLYDQAFASYFEGIDAHFSINDEILAWLENPQLPRELTEDELRQLQTWDLDKLREEFEKRLQEQTERHDGGNRWIGTGGTSPFGHSGRHPAGIRVGGTGKNRSAVQIASLRRFRNLRSDHVLNTRHVGVALQRLRRLSRDTGAMELDINMTIDKSAKNGGEIDLVFARERANRIKLLLLIDVGGSMDPHFEICEQLFSAAHKASHFKAFEHYTFHNCFYEHLYTDISRYESILTQDLLKRVDSSWTVIVVGDAWMSPYELTYPGGNIYWGHHNPDPGLVWLQRLRQRCPNSLWLNPEPPSIWHAESVQIVRHVFPMFHLTLDGLTEAVDILRGACPNESAFDRTGPIPIFR
ncbi:MAG: VWA domain-containing protein [Myxococcota bacterium]